MNNFERRLKVIREINRISKLESPIREFSFILLIYFSQEINAEFSFFISNIREGFSLREFYSNNLEVNIDINKEEQTQFLFPSFFEASLDEDVDYVSSIFISSKKITNSCFELNLIKQGITELGNFYFLMIPLYQSGKLIGCFEFFLRKKITNADIIFTEIIATYVLSYIKENKISLFLQKKEKIESKLKGYFSKSIYNDIINNKIDLYPFQRKALVSMFVDIRGFTSYSESTELESLHQIINRYIGWLSELIINYDGTIDKYMGDGVFCFWGAPIANANFITRSISCAINIIQEFQKKKEESFFPKEWGLGVGMAYGDSIVGSVGIEVKQYTAIGRSVNLASRLCSEAKDQLFISESLYLHNQLRDYQKFFTSQEKILLKGFSDKEVAYIYP